MKKCSVIKAVEAKIKVGNKVYRAKVDDAMKNVVFDIDLNKGPTEVRSWFADTDGGRWVACYVDVSGNRD